MLRSRFALALAALLVCSAWLPSARADNPIVRTAYTADPAPMIYDGRLYVYTSHDEDVTVNNFFTMNDWRVYSTADMVNWTDHGSPLGYKSFSWAGGSAWAGQCIPRNGKFYWYVPMAQKSGAMAIGVAVSNTPIGPFTDALGKPLASTGAGDIDPSVFIDADGQAYLYWGNPNLYYVRLNEDMISYAGTPTKVSLTSAGFGARSNSDRATAYEEGPWFYKRGSLYYIVYPGDGVPENISYTTSSSPTGPWTFRGVIMDKQMGAGTSFTNHPGVVDFAGNSYFFYHNGALPGGGGYKRSVCVERFSYNADGTFPKITISTSGPPAVANLNPYLQTEAETMASESGIETEPCSEGGMNVTSIQSGDSILLKSVDFGTGAISFSARVAAASGGSLELRLDSAAGTMLGTCAIQSTGGAQVWATQSCTINGGTGKHDLLLRFSGSGGDLFKLNWWKFTPKDPLPDGGGADAGAVASDAGRPPAMSDPVDAASGVRGVDSSQASADSSAGTGAPSQGPIIEAGASEAGSGTQSPAGSGTSAQDSSDGGGCQIASGRRRNSAAAAALFCLGGILLRRRRAGGGRLAA